MLIKPGETEMSGLAFAKLSSNARSSPHRTCNNACSSTIVIAY
jgi:hypothetical protein